MSRGWFLESETMRGWPIRHTYNCYICNTLLPARLSYMHLGMPYSNPVQLYLHSVCRQLIRANTYEQYTTIQRKMQFTYMWIHERWGGGGTVRRENCVWGDWGWTECTTLFLCTHTIFHMHIPCVNLQFIGGHTISCKLFSPVIMHTNKVSYLVTVRQQKCPINESLTHKQYNH